MINEVVNIYYKDGQEFLFQSLMGSTIWHRGEHVTKKSRKSFTCACGCNIPAGSTYLTLEMMAGGGCGTFLADFALCSKHQKATEALLDRSISTDVSTVDIIKAWVKILQSESNMVKTAGQTEASAQYAATNNSVALRSYSWEIRSEICAVKTVDKSLLRYSESGIPPEIVAFFTDRQIDEGQKHALELSLLGTIAHCTVSCRHGRHRLELRQFKQTLLDLGMQVGDLMFFERDVTVPNRFNISVLNQNNKVIARSATQYRVGEDKAVYKNIRLGQDLFREQVKRAYSNRCGLSGIEDTAPSILIASHIKPWSLAEPAEKTDIFNGLLLAPHYDKLFDRGLISFSDDGKIMLSNKLPDQVVQEWDLENKKLRTVYPQSAAYLGFHREHFKF